MVQNVPPLQSLRASDLEFLDKILHRSQRDPWMEWNVQDKVATCKENITIWPFQLTTLQIKWQKGGIAEIFTG